MHHPRMLGVVKYMRNEDLTCGHCRRLRTRREFVPNARLEPPDQRNCLYCQTDWHFKAHQGLRRAPDLESSPYVWSKSYGTFTEQRREQSCPECASVDEVGDSSTSKKERAWKLATRANEKFKLLILIWRLRVSNR